MNPEDNEPIENMSDAEDDTGDVHQEPSYGIIDLVVDGKATEARDAIYAALYQKVGEKIDTLRSNTAEAPVEVPSDSVEIETETPEQE